MQRLPRYHKGIEKGLIKTDAVSEIVFETPVSAVIDGHDGMRQLIGHTEGKGGTCHGFIAVDPSVFGEPEMIQRHFSTFLQELREAPKAEGKDRIYTHGEKEILALERVKAEGVAVDVKTIMEMKQMSEYLEMDFEKYFGELSLGEEDYQSIY